MCEIGVDFPIEHKDYFTTKYSVSDIHLFYDT